MSDRLRAKRLLSEASLARTASRSGSMAISLYLESAVKLPLLDERRSPDSHTGPSTKEVIVALRFYGIAPPRLTVRLQRMLMAVPERMNHG